MKIGPKMPFPRNQTIHNLNNVQNVCIKVLTRTAPYENMINSHDKQLFYFVPSKASLLRKVKTSLTSEN